MGSVCSKCFDDNFKKKHIKALMLGLEGAGKTTIINKFKTGKSHQTNPTLGIRVQTLELKKVRLTVWDVGRQQNLTKILKRYYPETSVVIYVVDSSDRDKIPSAKKQLDQLIRQEDLKDVRLLVLANKHDIPSAMSISEVCEKLGLLNLKGRNWLIQGISGVTGQGIVQCYNWLDKEQ